MSDFPSRLALPDGRGLDLSGPPLVMAIVNCTDDSFYAPSRATAEEAVDRALAAVAAGAAIVDIGGESTRPGAAYVSAEEELSRVLPVVTGLRRRSDVAISVDTRKAQVARAALDEGADIVNDVSALEDDPDLAPVCARHGAAVVLMHKKGIPADMQDKPYYEDVVQEVRSYLEMAILRAESAGITRDRIVVDPGIGFGKRLVDNLDLIRRLAEIGAADYPVLVGLSRKSFIGALTGRGPEGRLAGTLAANAAAIFAGARILRVHDVEETVDLVRVMSAVSAAAISARSGGGRKG